MHGVLRLVVTLPCLLHHQQPAATLHYMADRVLLPLPELGIRSSRTLSQQRQRTLGLIHHEVIPLPTPLGPVNTSRRLVGSADFTSASAAG